jgi:nicotinamidase-related amidase
MNRSEALIIVDLQCAFLVPPPLVERIKRYAKRFRRRVFTRFVNPPGSQFRKVLKMDCCAPGSMDTELLIHPEKNDLVLSKPSYGLTAAQISRLKRLGVRKAIVCGVETDACVLAVMFSLFDGGIECRAEPALCWSSTGLHREGTKILTTQFPKPRRGRRGK